MDIADIKRVASRKRLNVDAEKLREKVSRETAKIIKLKVAQDTAYWDLKEKLHQLENNHERLQQNMVDVQMQHETISGQYQDELRLRPETLNKLSSTREICDVLEEYSERLKETVSRCKADQATLCEAYQKSGQFVKDITLKQAQAEERNKAAYVALEEKLKLTTEHQSQLLALFNSSKQQADALLLDTQGKLDAAQQQRDELLRANGDLARDLEQQRHAVDARERNISSLQSDMKRLLLEFDNQCNEMKTTILKQEKDLKESIEGSEALKKALTNQEDFTKSVCEQNNALQEKVSSLEEEGVKLYDEIAALRKKVENMAMTKESLTDEKVSLVETKASLEKELVEKNEILTNAAKEIERLLAQATALEAEKACLIADIGQVNEESQAKSVAIDQLAKSLKGCEGKVTELERALQEYKAAADEKIKGLELTIDTKHSENLSKGETITKLMNEIKLLMEQRSKLETTIERARKEMEIERERAIDKERKLSKQVEQLEVNNKEKDQELSKQMSIILEIRAEKEKLQDKISGMQGTINNIQKELTGRLAPREPQLQPEQDDNAVVMSPMPMNKSQNMALKASQKSEFTMPRHELSKQPDNMLFNIFSDNSMDGGDAIDPVEVNRRFEAIARGERLPQMPLSSLKRRRPPMSLGGLQAKPALDNDADSPISLSQLRNDIKHKEKTFFKTKRAENKLKKFKISDNKL